LAFSRFSLPVRPIIPNMLLLQSWIPIKGYYFSGNAVSWCLSNEIFFYFIFPVLVVLINKFSLKFGMLFFLCVITLYIFLIQIIPELYHHALFYINPLFRLSDFCIGIFIYLLYRFLIKNKILQRIRKRKVFVSFFETGSLSILFFMIFFSSEIPQVYRYASYYWLPMCILIMVFSYFNNCDGVISKLLSYKFIIKLGEASFCFYMIHALCIRFFNACLDKVDIISDWFFRFPIIFLLTAILSLVCYRYFEKPISNRLNNKI
jgi:peptidoglycan/LPS O-acetylase OafA/YrhL